MEERLFLRRIREEFPDVTWTSHRYLTHGWDHAVLILDEALVFRAPKAQAYRDALPKEARLLRYLQPRVDVGIPDYVFEPADGSFAGYRLLAGRELDAVTFGRLSETEKERIAEQLATFLSALHETPKSVARDCGASEQDPRKDHEDLVRDVETLAYPRLAPREVDVIRAFLTELAAEVNPTRPTVLVHGDLDGEHILWDAENEQVNIIDFSDRSIGDPALDFAGLPAYGRDFAQRGGRTVPRTERRGDAAKGAGVLPADVIGDDGGRAPRLSVYVRGGLRGVQGAVRSVSLAAPVCAALRATPAARNAEWNAALGRAGFDVSS